MRLSSTIIILATLSIATFVGAEPPRLTSTSPTYWAVGVNASTQKTISLVFDQPLRPGFSDWLGRGVLVPDSHSGSSISSDQLTASLNVQLLAGKVYILGLNEKGIPGVGFQNVKGQSLPPTYLVFQTAGTPSSEDAPPRVAKTVPSNGATALDPTKLKSIAITFDVPMNPKKHGLHLTEDGKAVDISRAPFQYSADGKTFTLGYDFKPSKTYALELNNLHDIGFARTTRVPLWPVKFSFSTESPQ